MSLSIPLIIGGEEVFSEQTFPSFSPYDESVLADVSSANQGHIEKAVSLAQEAQHKWKNVAPQERAEILLNCAKLLKQKNDELARWETLDTGRPIRETKYVDIVSASECLEYMAENYMKFKGRHIPLNDTSYAYTLHQPLGVCLGIGAWNYPLQIAAWKSAPALMCGNSFIFKPSELTPITAYMLAGLYKQAGLPDGLFQVIQGGAGVGQALVEHNKIHKVSLTGSVLTGLQVYESSARTLKKVSLELGGKSPLIIFEDADLDSAVQAAMLANFYSQGEICSNGTRVFVHKNIEEDFLRKFEAEVKKIKMGDPLDETVHMGPLISQEHKEKVLYYLEVAQKEGSLFYYEDNLREANFIGPVILYNCQDDHSCSQDEIFGPVASVFSFSDTGEVIQRANNTPYGLAAGVFSNNEEFAKNVAAQLEVGMTWINTYNVNPIDVPFGGAKKSGIGVENGLEVFKEYTRLQSFMVNHDPSLHSFF